MKLLIHTMRVCSKLVQSTNFSLFETMNGYKVNNTKNVLMNFNLNFKSALFAIYIYAWIVWN